MLLQIENDICMMYNLTVTRKQSVANIADRCQYSSLRPKCRGADSMKMEASSGSLMVQYSIRKETNEEDRSCCN